MTTAYRDAVLADTPQVYYRLGEAVGTTGANTVLDSSGNSHAATPTSITFGATGISDDANTAATFVASSSSTILSSYSPPNGAAFSLEFWVKTNGSDAGLISSNNNSYFEVGVNSNGQLRMIYSTTTDFRPIFTTTSAALTLNQWYHVVYTWELSTGKVNCYIDGQLVVTTTFSTAGNFTVNSGPLLLGHSSGYSNYLDGSLDEVAWYNYALSATRVAAHYAACATSAVTAPKLRTTLVYAEQVVKPQPRLRIPFVYAEQVVQPRPRVRMSLLFGEQILIKAPVPANYYANTFDANTADFEGSSTGQVPSSGPQFYQTAVQSASFHQGAGSKSCLLSATSSGQTNAYWPIGGDTGAVRLGLVPGYKYTFSAWVYVPIGQDAIVQPQLEIWDNNGAGYQPTASSRLTTRGVWTRLSVSRTIRAGANEAFIRVNMLGAGGTTPTIQGQIYIDKLMLDPSANVAQPNPWQPAGFQGFLVDAGNGTSSRSRTAPTANPTVVTASTQAYENVTSLAGRTSTDSGIAQLYSSTATPVNATGTSARTRAGSATGTVRVANDNLADAVALTQLTTPFNLDPYTTETGEPYANYRSAWWKFTAVSTGTSSIQVTSNYYQQTNVFSGPATNPTFATLNWVAGTHSSYDYGGNTYNFSVVAGTTYYVQLAEEFNSTGVNGNIIRVPPPVVTTATATCTRTRSTTAVRRSVAVLHTTTTATRTRSTAAVRHLDTVIRASSTMSRQRSLVAHAGLLHYLFTTAMLTRTRTVTAHGNLDQPPRNDDPYFATYLTGTNGSLTFSDVAASLDDFDPPLPSTVMFPDAGTVWFTWIPPQQGDLTVTSSAATGLDAYALSTDWMLVDADAIADNWYLGGPIKVYRVNVPTDMTEAVTWTAPASPAGNTTQDLYLDFYGSVLDDEDPTAEGFHGNLLFDAEVVTFAGHAPGTHAFGPYAAGDYYLIAQQYDENLDTVGNPVDPIVNWNPATNFGTFTDRFGNPVAAPFAVTEQLVLGFAAQPLTLPVASGVGTASWTTRANEGYAIRAYPTTFAAEAVSLPLTWATVAGRRINATLVDPTLTTTPSTLTVAISAEPPGEVLTFELVGDPTVLATASTDVDGIARVVVPIGNLVDGSYSLSIAADNGGVATLPFTVAHTVVVTDPPPPPDTGPPPGIPPIVVAKWVLDDPVTGERWVFPINPVQVEEIYRPKPVSAKTTTAVDGQPLLFEGAQASKPWQFKGNVLTLDDRDALESWVARPYRVYLTDDFGRSFVVKFTQVQMTPVRDVLHPEHHTYTAAALLYGRKPA